MTSFDRAVITSLLTMYGNKFGKKALRKKLKRPLSSPQKAATLLASLGGAGYAATGGLADFSNPLTFVKSILGGKDYYDPKIFNKLKAGSKKRLESANVGGFGDYALRASQELEKNSYDQELFGDDPVPIHNSMETISDDPFLDTYDKLKTNALVFDSEKKGYGLTSKQKLTTAAVRAGAGAIPATAFGYGVGKLLGLNKKNVKRLSITGGLAAAIKSSGVLNEFG